MFIGAERLGTDRAAAVAALAGRSSSTSRRSGASPTTASGRRAGRGGTTRTPRSWPGSCSTARVRLAERFELEAPLERWRQIRDEIHREVCERGYDPRAPHVHPVLRLAGARRQRPQHPARRLPARRRRARDGHDRRGLARARPRRLRLPLLDRRDRRRPARRRGPVPGLLVLAGQCARAQRPRRRGAGAVRAARSAWRNDLGLLAEEYDVGRRRQVGNFPQAFSHLTLILARARSPQPRRDARRTTRVSAIPRAARHRSCRAQVPGSAGARAVHLQLRGLEHERDDQRHQPRTWTRPCKGVQAAITLFLLIMAILMIPVQQADRPLGPQALLHRSGSCCTGSARC